MQHYIPPFSWFERVTHLAIVEYMRRSLAPEFVRRQQEDLAEKERLLRVMAELPNNAQNSLRKHGAVDSPIVRSGHNQPPYP